MCVEESTFLFICSAMTHYILRHKAELSSKKTNGNFVLCTETINTRGCRFVRSPSYFPHFNHSHNFCKQPKSQPPCHVSRFNCIRKAPFFNRQFRGRYSTCLLLLLPPPSPLWYACCLINYFLGGMGFYLLQGKKCDL